MKKIKEVGQNTSFVKYLENELYLEVRKAVHGEKHSAHLVEKILNAIKRNT